MNVFHRMAAVRKAHARAESARLQWHTATNGLLSRGRARPLTVLGVAAGAGLLMGRCNVRLWRIPGLGALLGGGLAEGVTLVTRVISEFGLAGFTGAGGASEDENDGARADGGKRTN